MQCKLLWFAVKELRCISTVIYLRFSFPCMALNILRWVIIILLPSRKEVVNFFSALFFDELKNFKVHGLVTYEIQLSLYFDYTARFTLYPNSHRYYYNVEYNHRRCFNQQPPAISLTLVKNSFDVDEQIWINFPKS